MGGPKHFFAYMARMKHIRRWGLMRNTQQENDAEHAAQVAMIAHALAVLRNTRFGGQVNAGWVTQLALYHDAAEVLTGDLATPVKYFNPEIKAAYRGIEAAAAQRLLAMLPGDMRAAYAPLLQPDTAETAWRLVKAADRIAAYLKCVEELSAGNREFAQAAESTLASIRALGLSEVDAFMAQFAPSFALSLDQLN
ncbi:MAG: 5'-deoxynucleotidase [Oscillospiraceae bacterium]|jgi:5'-deoxynucleotidase|nr:5'-deoxynucleotidase [Oscillospiraceae bacterium]